MIRVALLSRLDKPLVEVWLVSPRPRFLERVNTSSSDSKGVSPSSNRDKEWKEDILTG